MKGVCLRYYIIIAQTAHDSDNKGKEMQRKVIIIDDSELIVNQLTSFFEKELDCTVAAVGYDGNEAVELYRKHVPDLITLDITMPNMDGQETIVAILSEFPDAKILMISAVVGDAMLECVSAGAKSFIEKPLKFNDPAYKNAFKATVHQLFDSNTVS